MQQVESCATSRSRQSIAVITVLAIMAVISVLVPTPAHAENPLYCAGTYFINEGCVGPRGDIYANETRNENGGCIANQMWTEGYGYSTPVEACNGEEITVNTTKIEEAFPKCWNRTNAGNLIHCRYEVW